MHDKLDEAHLMGSSVKISPVFLKDILLLDVGKEYIIRAFSTPVEDVRDYIFIPDHENLEKRGIICRLMELFVIRIVDFQ